MRPYEDQIRYWAAKKYNIPVDNISKVELELETNNYGYCETCSYEETEIMVTMTRHDQRDKDVRALSRYDLGSIVREIMEA